jgi:hypothetical protein
MDLGEIGFGDVDWIHLAQDREGGELLWTRWWILGFHKMRWISWLAERTLTFSRRTLLHGVS